MLQLICRNLESILGSGSDLLCGQTLSAVTPSGFPQYSRQILIPLQLKVYSLIN